MSKDKPFNTEQVIMTKEQAMAYATGRANGVAGSIGPKHLRVLEVDFLKPGASNPRDRHDDWE